MSIAGILATVVVTNYTMSYAVLDVLLPKFIRNPTNFCQESTVPVTRTRNSKRNFGSDRHQLKILLPLYIYPNWYERDRYIWQQAISAATKVQIVAIINPNNGPDRAPPNTDYQQGIKDLRQAGIQIVGYVPTNYATRSLSEVRNDIDLYFKHFNVDGIFIDETANTLDKLTYYRQIYQQVKGRSARYQVILNPGTDIAESYIREPVADVLVVFENYQKVWTHYQPPAYLKNYSAEHFAALIHTTASSQAMKATIDRALKAKFGYIYVTDDSTDTVNRNPWDSLPSYWQAQVNYIHQLNTAK